MKNIRRYVFCTAAIIVTTCTVLWSQTLKTLETNNGFKIYKLGSKFYSGYGVKVKDEDGVDKVVINYSRDKIGDIPVQLIELHYLKDTLSKIVVRISPENYIKLLDACNGTFGPPTSDLSFNETTAKTKNGVTGSTNSFRDQYQWKTRLINMEYYYLYPKYSGGAYGFKELYLSYSLNDYPARLQRVKNLKYSPKNF